MDRFLKFLPMLQTVAGLSKDPSTKVGAIAFDENMNIVSTGYNGFPRRVRDTPERYADRELKYKLVCHAEQNVVAQAAYAGHAMRNTTVMVSSLFPCSACAKSLIQAGVVCIISPPPDTDPRWLEEAQISELLFLEAGITTHYIVGDTIIPSYQYESEQ